MLTPAVAQHTVHFVQVVVRLRLGQRLLAHLWLTALHVRCELIDGCDAACQMVLLGRLAVGREADLVGQLYVHFLIGSGRNVQCLRRILQGLMLLNLHIYVYLGAQRVLRCIRVTFLLAHEAHSHLCLARALHIGLVDELEILLGATLQLIEVHQVKVAHALVVVVS